jgi:hypothetical protein
MGRISRNEEIVRKMEALAIAMLARVDVKSEKVNLDLQMDVFERVGKWIAIKNKLENDDGNGIADYKRRLTGETDKHVSPSRRPRRGNPEETGGRALQAIKSRIPGADDGGDDGDSGAAGGEVPAAVIGSGSLYPRAVDGGQS